MMNPTMDPNVPPPLTQSKDVEHLRLLGLFHYIVAGIGALAACIPIFHVVFGIMMITNPEMMSGGQDVPPPAWFGYLFAGVGILFVLFGWAAAICTFLSGRYLARRRRRMFSLIVAGVLCMFAPFGTVLGVFTIVVLSKDSVQRLYKQTESNAIA